MRRQKPPSYQYVISWPKDCEGIGEAVRPARVQRDRATDNRKARTP